jgi:hypothetical protein
MTVVARWRGLLGDEHRGRGEHLQAKQNRKAMFFFKFGLSFWEYDGTGSESDTGTCDSVVKKLMNLSF